MKRRLSAKTNPALGKKILKEREQEIRSRSRAESKAVIKRLPQYLGLAVLAGLYWLATAVLVMMIIMVATNMVTILTRSVTNLNVGEMDMAWFLNLAFLPGLGVTLIVAGLALLVIRWFWSQAFTFWKRVAARYVGRFLSTSRSITVKDAS